MKEIVPGALFQSSAAEAIAICDSNSKLTALGLKAILTVANNVRLRAPSDRIHLHLPIDEQIPVPEGYFELACKLSAYPLLVHCQAGANRSRIFAAAIAHKVFGLKLEEALKRADAPQTGIMLESLVQWAAGVNCGS